MTTSNRWVAVFVCAGMRSSSARIVWNIAIDEAIQKVQTNVEPINETIIKLKELKS